MPASPNTTEPLPPKVWLPEKLTIPYDPLAGLPNCTNPLLRVNPLTTTRLAPLKLLPMSRLPSTVTPLRVPPTFPSTINTAPLVAVTVPPSISPPLLSIQVPPRPLTDSVVFVLLSVPYKYTVALLTLNAPRFVNVSAPPKLTSPLVASKTPRLVNVADTATFPLLKDKSCPWFR